MCVLLACGLNLTIGITIQNVMVYKVYLMFLECLVGLHRKSIPVMTVDVKEHTAYVHRICIEDKE